MDYRVCYNAGGRLGIVYFDSRDSAKRYAFRVIGKYLGHEPITIQKRETRRRNGRTESHWD